jgi:hypothetical protein
VTKRSDWLDRISTESSLTRSLRRVEERLGALVNEILTRDIDQKFTGVVVQIRSAESTLHAARVAVENMAINKAAGRQDV